MSESGITPTITGEQAAANAVDAAGAAMDHGAALGHLTGLAIVVVIALACGVLLARIKQPAAVGYILAGLVMGPSALGLVENRELIQFMAELGVILLLFLVGMELSLKTFSQLWRIAFGTFGLQLTLGLAAAFLVGLILGWDTPETLVLAFVLSLSSTAVAIKMLEDLGDLEERSGQIAVGVLIAQDLAVVPMMLVIAAFGSGDGLGWGIAGKLILALGIMAVLVFVLLRRGPVQLPFSAIITKNPDLRVLGGITFCFAAAAISGLIGLSTAYGAFLAGLVIGNSRSSHEMQQSILPVQSILVMVFFLSIGLLIDLDFIVDNLLLVCLLVLLVLLVKTAANIAFLRLLGESWECAVVPGALLGQIGEFAFVLGALALAFGLLGDETYRLIVAVTVLSLVFSPAWMVVARRTLRYSLAGVSSGRELFRLILQPERSEILKLVARLSALFGWNSSVKSEDRDDDPKYDNLDDEARAKDAASGLPPIPF
ncbi:cation:proton antiporter [Limibacillus sp. MBR-115]|jgi:CPA2 family monovalent cation:H+ antiporter-2|uniref:cation:proton antiporter n=1 Tax=Limibacillus sp. MBR-115 TaxID=3156465 RepID=UPI0033974D57